MCRGITKLAVVAKLHELSGEGSLKEFSYIKSTAIHFLIYYMTEKIRKRVY